MRSRSDSRSLPTDSSSSSSSSAIDGGGPQEDRKEGVASLGRQPNGNEKEQAATVQTDAATRIEARTTPRAERNDRTRTTNTTAKPRRPPLDESSVSSTASLPNDGAEEEEPPPPLPATTAPNFISFTAVPSTPNMAVFDAAFAAVPQRLAERRRDTARRKAGKRRQRSPSRKREASPPPSSSSSSATAVVADRVQVLGERDEAQKHLSTRKPTRKKEKKAQQLALSAARELTSALLTRATPPATTPATEENDDGMTVYINHVPTRLSRSEPYIAPATVFAPHVLLLDCTAATVQQAAVPPALRDATIAELQAAIRVLRRERHRLRSAQSHAERRLLRASRPGTGQQATTSASNGNNDMKESTSPVEERSVRVGAEATPQGLVRSDLHECICDIKADRATLKEEVELLEKMVRLKRSGTPLHTLWHQHLQEQDAGETEDVGAAGGLSPLPGQQPRRRRKEASSSHATPVSPASAVLLLPSPTTGLVRLVDGHHYLTVKFVGEHLRLTGRLESWLPSPLPPSPPPPPLPATGEHKASPSRETPSSSPGWASMELQGMYTYLRRHPGATADDYFKLPAEEMAVHTLAEE